MEYPYVLTLDKFGEFLGTLETVGVPDRVDQKFLATLGYTSSNDRKFIQTLRFLDLVDQKSGTPTEAYQRVFREGEEGRIQLAQIMREKYEELFRHYPDAHRKDSEALQNFFKARTKLGSRALQSVVATFRTLCAFANFESEPSNTAASSNGSSDEVKANGATSAPKKVSYGANADGLVQPLTINVNIQLELPSTSDADVYEALFASMAKHVLRLSDG